MKPFFILFTSILFSQSELIISGVLDLAVHECSVSGKAIEVSALGDIYDMSEYSIDVANNGYRLDGPAFHQEYYIFEVTTLDDSTLENNEMAINKVVASMNDDIFYSDPDSGYSIDNIALGIPKGLLAMANVNMVLIDWDLIEAEDFQYFILERSLSTSFIEENTISMELVETSYLDKMVDIGTQYYYRVRAVDYAGNIGDNSDTVTATALSVEASSVISTRYALSQNYPNSFNLTTKINYHLSKNTFVSIVI